MCTLLLLSSILSPRDIEIMLQDIEDRGEGTVLSASIFKVLYATGTHTYTHIHTHTYIHTYTQTHTHRYSRTVDTT
jgi:ribosomal protein S3AE